MPDNTGVAPGGGRQSPEPEQQSKAQQGSTTDNANDQGAGVKGGSEKQSDNTLSGLPSNPEQKLTKAAEEKTSKTVK